MCYAYNVRRRGTPALIYKRGKKWWYKFDWNGQTIRKSCKTSNENTAIQIEAAARTSLAKREVGILDNFSTPTVAAFAPRLFGHLAAHVSKGTLAFYKNGWRHATEYKALGSARLHMVDVELIDGFAEHLLTKEKLDPTSVNHSLRSVRRGLRLAVEWGLINKSPKFKMVAGERQREFVISDETFDEMMKLARPDMQRLIPFLIDTGLRINESCSLTWDRVGFQPKEGAERGWIYINKGKTKYAKRYVPLTQRAWDVLHEQKAVSKSQFVWVRKDRNQPMSRNYATHRFTRLRDALGLPWDCVLHSTRHTFCTKLGESGADAFTIQRLAGHSSITISQKYVHPTPKHLENAISGLEKKVGTAVVTSHKIRVLSGSRKAAS